MTDSSTWLNGHLAYAGAEQGASGATVQYPGAMAAPPSAAFLGGAAPGTGFDQNAPGAAADPNLKVLSPEEVQHELNAMDPDTRQRTLEMGHRLRDIVQAALDVAAAAGGPAALPPADFKAAVLARVGPLPAAGVELPLPALRMLYQRLYSAVPGADHDAVLATLSAAFAAGEAPAPAPVLQPLPTQPQPVLAAVPDAAAVTPAPAPAPAAAAAAGKKLVVSKEQYEKLLAKMTPEERSKHPKYEQVMKQYEKMGAAELQRTAEAGLKLREFLKASLEIFRGVADPGALPYEAYRAAMGTRFGAIPSYTQWELVTYGHLCTMYDTIYNTSHKAAPPHVAPALRALARLLPNPGDGGGSGGAQVSPAAAPAMKVELRPAAPEAPAPPAAAPPAPPAPPTAPAAAAAPEDEVDWDSLPPEVEISCNMRRGTFLVRVQRVVCRCEVCVETAAAAGRPRLELSPGEFERHCGLPHAQKWRKNFKLAASPTVDLHTWLKGAGVPRRPSKSVPDDVLLRAAEWEHARLNTVGEMDAERRRTVVAAAVAAAAAEVPLPPGQGPPAMTAPARAPAPRERQRKPAKRPASEDVSPPGGGGGDSDPGGAAAGERAHLQRQRKKPKWMRGTIDPSALLGRSLLEREVAVALAEETPVPVGAGPRGGLAAQRARGGVAVHTPDGRVARVDPDALLEAEIDGALARGHQPDLGGWRVTEGNQLALTVTLGGVTFSGVLPARPARVASSPAIALAALEDPRSAALAGPVRPRGGKAAAAADADAAAGMDLPPVPPSAALAVVPALVAAGAVHAPPAVAAAAGNGREVLKEMKMEERRAAAAAEYERLLVSGPPEGTTCALCRGEAEPAVARVGRTATGRARAGLGEFILIRASTISNAWVHDQCARWSPDVFDPTGDGLLEGIPAAVRRGRMLKCKVCGEKGATLGCLKKTCKASYHLACARRHGCLLHDEPYAVACPEHVEQLPDGLSVRLGYRRGGGRRPPRARAGGEEGARGGGAPRREGSAAAAQQQAAAAPEQAVLQYMQQHQGVPPGAAGIASLAALGALAMGGGGGGGAGYPQQAQQQPQYPPQPPQY